MLRGLLTGGIGLMIATIGYDGVTGTTRFTGGIEYLWDGVHLVPALIGLFAVAEMINLSVNGGTVAKDMRAVKITSMMSGVNATFRHWRTVLRGSIIGTVVGAIPGEGGTVAAFLSYSMTVQASDDPDSFGKGNIQGVIAPEAAINAKDGSALIPTLAFGIPSGAEMAVFLGILVLHGMQPGPLMLAQNQNEIYGLVWALTGACILASFIGVLLARPLGAHHAGRFPHLRADHHRGRDGRVLCGRPQHREPDPDARLRHPRLYDDPLRLSAAHHRHRAGARRHRRAQFPPVHDDGRRQLVDLRLALGCAGC